MDRRNFLRTSMAGAAIAMSGSALTACAAKPAETEKPAGKGPELKLSLQENKAPGKTLEEQFDYMEAHGVVGFEPGGGGLPQRVESLKKALSGRNIQVSAICAGFKGFILSTDPAIRKQCMDTMKEIIAAAGELGSTGVIIASNSTRWAPMPPSMGRP